MSAVPSRMVIEIPAAEQVRLRKHLRRVRWGGWLALHILLLLSQPRSPTAIAEWLLCSPFDCLRGGLGLAARTPSLGACLWRVCCPAIG
ncbi:MAG: hypothetical protein JOZ45_15980, partial [Acidobacteriaceae bacterium]|nr:hypothetical protein [Acidobacteriaceae bacterium]